MSISHECVMTAHQQISRQIEQREAFEALEAMQALDSLCQENEDLRAENLLLQAQLVTAREKLATANVYTNRRGW